MTTETRHAIYETRGRAREFSELAANLYTGCGHGCLYCYGPEVTKQDLESFVKEPRPRADILNLLSRDASRLRKKGETRPILLSFVTDPFQPIEASYHITQMAIEILHANHLRVTILTKAGLLALNGIDQLRKGDAFATTLTFHDAQQSQLWEPHAAIPIERLINLRAAHKAGLETWVSCEPVIDPAQTLTLIAMTQNYADHYKVGTLNYHPHAKTINWPKFAMDVVTLLDSLGKSYYIKKDLAKHLPPDTVERLRGLGRLHWEKKTIATQEEVNG
jgi:DNA repair photolyase